MGRRKSEDEKAEDIEFVHVYFMLFHMEEDIHCNTLRPTSEVLKNTLYDNVNIHRYVPESTGKRLFGCTGDKSPVIV